MAKLKARYAAGPAVVHTFNGGFSKDRKTRAFKQVTVPTSRLVYVDPSRDRYMIVNGRRRLRPKFRNRAVEPWRMQVFKALAGMSALDMMPWWREAGASA